jgi:hypothetical protein
MMISVEAVLMDKLEHLKVTIRNTIINMDDGETKEELKNLYVDSTTRTIDDEDELERDIAIHTLWMHPMIFPHIKQQFIDIKILDGIIKGVLKYDEGKLIQ